MCTYNSVQRNTHTPPGDQCSYAANTKANVDRHKLVHDEVEKDKARRFVCDKCDYATAHSHDLIRHKQRCYACSMMLQVWWFVGMLVDGKTLF
jgi:hypothetical protein